MDDLVRQMTSRRTTKASGIFLSFSAIFLASLPPATEYEISVYNHTSLALWVCLALSLVFLVLTIVLAERRSHLLVGSGLALVFYTLLFSVPAAKGYHLYGRGNSDILYHIGHAKAINQVLDWYPAIHLEMRFLHEFGLSWELVATVLAIVFSFLFAIGTALYARSLLERKHAWKLTFAAAFIPILGPFTRLNHPAVYSFMLLPLVLWSAQKAKQNGEIRYIVATLPSLLLPQELWSTREVTQDGEIRDTIVTMVMSTAIVIFHPVTVALLLAALVIDDFRGNPTLRSSNIAISVIIGVLAAGWYMGFGRFAVIIEALTAFQGGGAASSSTSAIFDPALTPIDIAIRGIEMYGAIGIIGILGGIATVGLLWDNLGGKGEPTDGVLIGHYLVSGAIGCMFLFVDLVVSAPIRAARYGVFASLLTFPNVTRHLSGRGRLIVSGVVMVLLTVVIALSIGAVYDTNKHFTEAEYEGASWQATHHSDSKPVYAHDLGKKMDLYLFGAASNRDVFASRPMPDRFGYDNAETVGRSLDEGYLVTKSYDLRFADVFVEGKRSRRMVYSEEDVERLSSDSAADSVYSNGGYSVWLV